MASLAALLASLLHPFSEARCPACLGPFAEKQGLCPACTALFQPRVSGFCPMCGEIYPLVNAPCTLCGACLKEAPPWASFHFHSTHAGLTRRLLLAAKFQSNAAVTRVLGQALAQVCAPLLSSATPPSRIVPMPLHPARLRMRGFNQCVELSRTLGKAFAIPLGMGALQRIRPTIPQTGLPRAQRLSNLAHAFKAEPGLVAGETLLLIDDTATTGSTLRHATLALLDAGAAAVHVAVVARSSRHF